MTQPSLDTLVREIEATPEEYWAEILTQLRQFRENVTHQPATNRSNILNIIEQIRSHQSEFLTPDEIDRQIQEERASWDS
jgi:hypothetical protein